MSNYQTPITIREALSHIESEAYLLPSIQREFVWSQNQIEILFDSLMQGYPIGTFLFWKVSKENIDNFQFYKFIRNYHERDCFHNEKIEIINKDSIFAILDGQQRLTSLYIALMGSYATKLPYYRIDNDRAYPVKKLYLNLFNRLDGELERKYEFKFLTEEEVLLQDGDCFWFPCSKILELNDMSKISVFMMRQGLMDTSKYDKFQSEFAMQTLHQFYNIIHQKGTISAYVETDHKLDKVLQIFIRINSGGTKLSYSDLLLSIATAQWSKRDAREEIHHLLDEINAINVVNTPSFNFSKDFILKSCLVLSDLDVKFHVDNFTKENMQVIEEKWDDISRALLLTVRLIVNLGFNGSSLTSHNALIPIANYIYTNRIDSKILDSTSYQKDRKLIREWLAKVILKSIFGGTPDAIYPIIRRLIKENLGKFPLKEITDYYRGHQRSIIFGNDELEALLELKYSDRKTYALLTLLYPSLNQNFIYHLDHLHPRYEFNKENYENLGLDEVMISFYENYKDRLANIQLLPSTQNQEKNHMPLKSWVETIYKNEADKKHFLREHHLSEDISLDFKDFKLFVKDRENHIRESLKRILGIKD